MSLLNLHKYYYKDYFSEADFKPLLEEKEASPASIKDKNKDLCSAELYKIERVGMPITPFNLKILYPGLVTGVGIGHEAKIEGEFKLGVHFDWTYGMPVIYGSSVKGVLREWFKEFYSGDFDSGDLMMNIFSGVYDRDIEAEKKRYKDKWEETVKYPEKRIYNSCYSIYKRDIFFDAVIVKPDKNGRILCSDSITPHPDPLKNPIPLTFLKIAPGCEIEFRFKLVDTTIGGKVYTADEKLKLFKDILTTVGVGAKTNVGYGQLKSV